MKKTKAKTLDDLVAEYGTQEKAAAAIDVTVGTLSRWLNGHNKPDRLARRRLREMGVAV